MLHGFARLHSRLDDSLIRARRTTFLPRIEAECGRSERAVYNFLKVARDISTSPENLKADRMLRQGTTTWCAASATPASRAAREGRQGAVKSGLSTRTARPWRRRDRRPTTTWFALRRRQRARAARPGRQGAGQRGDQARTARPWRGRDRRLRGLVARFGDAASRSCCGRSPWACSQGRDAGTARPWRGRARRLRRPGLPASATRGEPALREAGRQGAALQGRSGWTARPSAKMSLPSTTTWWRRSATRSVASAARAGRQGAALQGRHARTARPLRGSLVAVYEGPRWRRFGDAKRARRCACRSPGRCSYKGVRLGQLDRGEDELAVYDDLVASLRRRERSQRCASRSPRRWSTRA